MRHFGQNNVGEKEAAMVRSLVNLISLPASD